MNEVDEKLLRLSHAFADATGDGSMRLVLRLRQFEAIAHDAMKDYVSEGVFRLVPEFSMHTSAGVVEVQLDERDRAEFYVDRTKAKRES